ncbi:MAG: hypothetical protein JWP68_3017 [Modestobacter sp.]|nr:hypothetical protein [Modestobacter sp.]
MRACRKTGPPATTDHGSDFDGSPPHRANLNVDDATTGRDFYEEFLGLRKEFDPHGIVVNVIGHPDQPP